MQQEMIDLLRRELPAVGDVYLKRVAAVILGEQIDCSMDALATGLFKSNVAVGKILAALLRCEWVSVQHLIAHTEPDNMRRQVQQFSDCIEHFNGLQEAVVNAADRSWRQSIDAERKSRVLAECKAKWLETGTVHIHNYFKEVPVSAKVSFVSFEVGQHLCVKATPELGRVFAVSDSATQALISSPDRKYNLQVTVFQCKHMELSLSVTGIVEALQECRREVRVKPGERISVELVVAGQHISADLLDLSCAGMGLHVAESVTFRSGAEIRCVCLLGTHRVESKQVRVCWVQKTDDGVRTGVELQPDAQTREVIYKYLFVQQQRIAGRIHQLGKPTWMK